MKLKVTFREYDLPTTTNPETHEEERGEYYGSFSEIIEGNTPIDILEIAEKKARKYSEENETDIRVWGTEVIVTPRGIISH